MIAPMKIAAAFHRRYRWINLPTATLVALLQRSPVASVVQVADEMITASPVGVVLRSAAAAAATLGALNSLAGATTLVSSPLTSPVSATVGVAISTTAITVNGTQSEPGSWAITTAIPPGLAFSNSSSATLTGAGNIDVPNGVLFLSGTPTTPGTYNVGMIAYEFAAESGNISPTYTFTIVVSASNAPSFTASPVGGTVNAGQSFSFTAAASGSPTYQWEKGGSPIAGATSATYTIPSPQLSDTGSYSVVATNGSGSTTSVAATLTVVSPSAAPVFTSQPLTQPQVNQGVMVNFNATAVGGTVSYQWEFGTGTLVTNGVDADGNTYSGATTSSLVVESAQAGAVYKVVATNANGSTTSSSATMTVISASQSPLFTTQPLTQAATVGQTVTFTAAATNAAFYQWYFGNNAISNAINPTYTITNVQTAASGTYFVIATSSGGMDIYGDPIPGTSTTSSFATLTVTTTALPAFTTQPLPQTVNVGQTVVFTAAATGSPTYQWTFDGAPITGNASATTATLTLTSVQLSAIGTYAVVATNAGGPVTSTSVSLNVINVAPPTFTLAASPSSVTVATGRSVAFNAIATGAPAPTYQWTLNGSTTIPGATGTTDSVLLITGATSANVGTYTCTATNSQGSVQTSATLAVVTTASPGYLTNLSSRVTVGTGGNILIAGFALAGSGSIDLLLRGVGPALIPAPFGVSGALTNTQLTLYDTVIPSDPLPVVTNSGWSNAFALGSSTVNVAPQAATLALMNSLGAFTNNWAIGSPDSALEVTPPVGGYTAQISGVGGATGIALAEVYDVDAYNPATRLVNLSTRAQVGTGSNILIGGFVIGGSTAETLLIRAVGPTLAGAPYNVGGTIAQPVLTIYAGSTPIYANSNWGGDATISAAINTVGAFPLNPSSSDAALLITLPPASNYTAQVSGVNNGTGVALLEVYDVF